ncbi:hypothetical protein PUN28_017884 [Cardiocondyla obscurior]|uniref:Uncharacterized protein n=1 Tax=Cardiocondyla obscurior TaxID=286306 RepID=A0AAW2EL01_9HYME
MRYCLNCYCHTFQYVICTGGCIDPCIAQVRSYLLYIEGGILMFASVFSIARCVIESNALLTSIDATYIDLYSFIIGGIVMCLKFSGSLASCFFGRNTVRKSSMSAGSASHHIIKLYNLRTTSVVLHSSWCTGSVLRDPWERMIKYFENLREVGSFRRDIPVANRDWARTGYHMCYICAATNA